VGVKIATKGRRENFQSNRVLPMGQKITSYRSKFLGHLSTGRDFRLQRRGWLNEKGETARPWSLQLMIGENSGVVVQPKKRLLKNISNTGEGGARMGTSEGSIYNTSRRFAVD